MITPEIFKANDIRGITEGPSPQWDEAGAYAIGAALVDVLDLTSAEGGPGRRAGHAGQQSRGSPRRSPPVC